MFSKSPSDKLIDDVLIEVASYLDSKSLTKAKSIGFFKKISPKEEKSVFNEAWKKLVYIDMTELKHSISDFREYYIQHYPLISKTYKALNNPLVEAVQLNALFLEIIKSGNEKIAKLLISKINLNDAIETKYVIDDSTIVQKITFLTEAVKTKNPALVETLLAHRANINSREEFEGTFSATSKTPLMIAAEIGSLKCVQILLQHQANKNLCCYQGFTAFDYAMESGNLGCICLLSNMPEEHHKPFSIR